MNDLSHLTCLPLCGIETRAGSQQQKPRHRVCVSQSIYPNTDNNHEPFAQLRLLTMPSQGGCQINPARQEASECPRGAACTKACAVMAPVQGPTLPGSLSAPPTAYLCQPAKQASRRAPTQVDHRPRCSRERDAPCPPTAAGPRAPWGVRSCSTAAGQQPAVNTALAAQHARCDSTCRLSSCPPLVTSAQPLSGMQCPPGPVVGGTVTDPPLG